MASPSPAGSPTRDGLIIRFLSVRADFRFLLFRFHLAVDTLDSTIRTGLLQHVRDFHPLDSRPTGRTGCAHSAVKALGASLGPVAAAWWLRGIVFGVSVFVLIQALGHLRHHRDEPHARWQLWLPAIALGSVDALPVSFTKGLVVDQSIEGLLVSTCVVVALPFLVSRLKGMPRRHERRTACLARLAHFSVFCWIVSFVILEHLCPVTEAFLGAMTIAIFLIVCLGLQPALGHLRATRTNIGGEHRP